LLTKAAYFHKPVIGPKNALQGKLAETFKAGIGVGPLLQDNLEALNFLRQESSISTDQIDNYARLQGLDRLSEAWEQLLWF